MSISSRLTRFRQPVLHLATLFAVIYTLTIGGTLAGIIIAEVRQISLILITGSVLVWAIVLWKAPHGGGLWSGLGPALLLWGIAYLLAVVKTADARVLMGTWYAGFYAGVWLVLVDLRHRGWPRHWVLDAVLFVCSVLALGVLEQVLGWFPEWWKLKDLPVHLVPPRPSFVYSNPNALGTCLAVALPIGLVRAKYSQNIIARYAWRLWTGLALSALYLTYSRGAWLGAGASILVLAILLRGRQSLQKRGWFTWRLKRRTVAAGVVVVLMLSTLLLLAVEAFHTPRRDIGPRLTLYGIALDVWRDHPWIGNGPFTYGLQMQEFLSIPPEEPQVNAHSLYLNVAAELGLVGLVALFVTLWLIAHHAWRRLREARALPEYVSQAGCCAALVAVGVHSTVDMTLMTPAIMMLVLVIIAVSIVSEHPVRAASQWAGKAMYGGAAILWCLLLVAAWRSMGVYAEYSQGVRALVDGDYTSGMEKIAVTAERQPNMPLYWSEYGYAAGLAASIGDERWLSQGINAYEQALALERSHAFWWANLAALLWQSGASSEAVEAMLHAVEYAPDYPDFWLNLGIFYETQGAFAEARIAFGHVLDLKPDWGYATFWQTSELRRAVVAANPPEPTPYMRAVSLADKGDWGAAVDLLKDSITRDPAQPLPYIRLAQFCIEYGRIGQAEEYLQAARLLVHNDQGWAWIAYIGALLAEDDLSREAHLIDARNHLWPDYAGSLWLYGLNVSYYQFLQDKVRGNLLPQLTALGPYPDLIEYLREAP